MILETVKVVREGRPDGVIINKSDMTDKDVLFIPKKPSRKKSVRKSN